MAGRLARFAARLVLRAYPDAARGDPALREREESFRRLASAANEGITIVIDGRIVEANNAFGRLFGYEVSEILGRPLLDFLAPESRASAERIIASVAEKPYEARAQRKGGAHFDVEVIVRSIPYRGRTALGCVVRDITERKEIDRLKNEFVSIVSHELRTPLTSIRGSLGLMEGGAVGELPPKARELARIARQNADRLIRLINDILDLEKIEAGKAQLTIAALDPAEVVETTIAELRTMAMQYGVTLTSRIDHGEPIAGDRDRVVQILTNLLSNAVKFSPQGSSVTVVAAEGRSGFLRFAVSDGGPGIPKDQQSRLFERFEQLESANTRRRGGTGLGLAISRSLVEQHGGRIGVESTPGKGSTFWFELPLLPGGRVSGEQELGAGGDATALLVIEDDPAVARVLDIILRREGHRVVLVGTLADARRVLGQPAVPAAILLDMGLPDGSGLEMLDHLAGTEPLAKVPVVVLSGDGPTGDERNARIFEWITKPFAKEELVRAVRAAVTAVTAVMLFAVLAASAPSSAHAKYASATGSDSTAGLAL